MAKPGPKAGPKPFSWDGAVLYLGGKLSEPALSVLAESAQAVTFGLRRATAINAGIGAVVGIDESPDLKAIGAQMRNGIGKLWQSARFLAASLDDAASAAKLWEEADHLKRVWDELNWFETYRADTESNLKALGLDSRPFLPGFTRKEPWRVFGRYLLHVARLHDVELTAAMVGAFAVVSGFEKPTDEREAREQLWKKRLAKLRSEGLPSDGFDPHTMRERESPNFKRKK